jgi:hypothetical protein
VPRASTIAFVLAALLVPGAPAVAALAERASVEDLARTSDAVVRGRVERQVSRKVGTRIVTDVEIRVAAVWRGAAPQQVVKMTVPGGVVGDLGQRVDGMATFANGEDVVVFAGRGSDGRWRVNGGAQGKFSVEAAEARPNLDRVTFLRSAVRAGERAAEPMPVAELERRVKEAR